MLRNNWLKWFENRLHFHRLSGRTATRRGRTAAQNRPVPVKVGEVLEDRTLLTTYVVDTTVDESDGDFGAGDLSLREIAALVPLAVFVLWIGLQPKFFLDRMHPTLQKVTHVAADSFDERHGSARSTAGPADTLAQTEAHDD